MDTSETYIKMRKKAVFDLPHKVMVGIDPHHIYGDIFMDYRGTFFVRWMDGWLDLPRQDQLQEMMGEEYAINLLYEFHRYYNSQYRDIPGNWSMEQLWLAFVMKEKYNKVWNGTDWLSC